MRPTYLTRGGKERFFTRAGAAAILAAAALWAPAAGRAAIPEPDNVIYGQATAGGAALTSGTVTALLQGETSPAASFRTAP